jgi:small-conductance mechanosensitive channel
MEDKKISSVDAFFGLIAPHKVFGLVIGFVIIALLVRIINGTSKRFQSGYPSHRLLSLQIATVMTFSIYIIGTFGLIYGVIRPPKELLLAVGGSAAVAIGFALKDLVSSIIAGLILLFDRPFQVGDRVSFGDTYGEIVRIGLRAVRLNTLDDNLVTIPNSKFLTDVVASGNAGALQMMVCVDFSLSLEADLRMAKDLLYEVVATSKYVYIKRPIKIVMIEKLRVTFFGLK